MQSVSLGALVLLSGKMFVNGQPSPSPSPSYQTTCTWNNGSTAFGSWDLSPLTSLTDTYVTTDMRDSTKKYYYNFCRNAFAGQAKPIPTRASRSTDACNFPTTSSGRAATGLAEALAWQYDEEPSSPNDNCYRLGRTTPGWSFSIYDAQKPAKGVVLTYPGGDGIFCPAGSTRTFSVEVLCSATQGNLVSFGAANVVEANTCDYRAQLKSLAGCPTACITGNTLCSGSGVCGFNTDAKRTQCFCNSGYSGATCGTHSSAPKGLSAEGIILIIVCLVLAGVLGLIGYMYIRLRKLNVDPSAYGDLQGKCA